MKANKNKIFASKGKVLYCEELKMYCTATTDKKHKWIEVDEPEDEEDE